MALGATKRIRWDGMDKLPEAPPFDTADVLAGDRVCSVSPAARRRGHTGTVETALKPHSSA